MIGRNIIASRGGTMRGRDMKCHVRFVGAVLLAAAACASPTKSTPPSVENGSAATSTSAASSGLKGEWDTGPYPAKVAREAIVAAGYTKADTYEVLGNKKRYEFHLTFYEEYGTPFVTATGWDPSKGPKPSEGDHGPYRLVPNHRIKLTCDVCDLKTTYMLFSYELDEETLTLRFIRNVNPDASAYDRRFGTAYGLSWTAAPFHRVG